MRTFPPLAWHRRSVADTALHLLSAAQDNSFERDTNTLRACRTVSTLRAGDLVAITLNTSRSQRHRNPFRNCYLGKIGRTTTAT